jgi:hypothetical protein
METYILNRKNYTIEQWYDMISQTEDLPALCDILERGGDVICDEFAHLFNLYTYELDHDSIRINLLSTFDAFRFDQQIDDVLYEDIIGYIEDNKFFQIAGDGDGLGFIVDIYLDQDFEEFDESCQFWFEDYE